MGRSLALALACFAGCTGARGEPHDAGREGRDAEPARDGGAPMDAMRADGGIAIDGGALDAGGSSPSLRFFEDVTARSIGWTREPLEDMRTFADRFSGGVCVLDADGRAPVDLFFTARGRGRSRLFAGAGALAWADATDALGLGAVGDAIGCLAFDADGDGDDDLVVSLVGGLELYLRDGSRFELAPDAFDAELEPGGMYASIAAGDVDGDGDLDLLVAGFLRVDAGMDPTRLCRGGVPCTADITMHAPIANLLLLREPDGPYVDRAATLAPALTELEPTLVVAIGGLLEDGAPALYVGNDLGGTYVDRLLARRAGGTFEDVGRDSGFAVNARGHGIDTMGFASGDLDRDGRLEHAVTSFEGDATAVFDCEAPGVCEDRGMFLGTRATRETFRWGPAFLDVDLDGWLDLIEATGHYYLEDELLPLGLGGPAHQPPSLLLNRGDGSLALVSPHPDDGLAMARSARGIARADLDDDGRPDIVLATAEGAPALLRNVHPPRGRWLRVVLEGHAPNTRGVGAVVLLETARGAQMAEQRAGEGYLGSFDRRLSFGVARDVTRATLRVRWPSGEESRTVVELDREVVVREP